MNRREFDPNARGPLDGVRVVDLSRLVAGNILTHVLADLGAEVIKVEKPGRGDDLRNWQTAGVPLWWQVYARNKKSLCLDLRQDAGRALLLRLAETAQVLVENYRPGTLETMGLGPDVLLARNPKLVVVRVSGWGQSGPWRKKPGFGTLVEAFLGLCRDERLCRPRAGAAGVRHGGCVRRPVGVPRRPSRRCARSRSAAARAK